MIRCNNCESLFKTENDLHKIVIQTRLFENGNWREFGRVSYYGQELQNNALIREEIIDGCPECMSDEYLMDIYNETTN